MSHVLGYAYEMDSVQIFSSRCCQSIPGAAEMLSQVLAVLVMVRALFLMG